MHCDVLPATRRLVIATASGMLLMIQTGDLLNHLLRLELFDICLLEPGDVVFSKPLHQQ